MRPDGPRDPVAGPDVPEPPFPLKLGGKVIKGFGRGSKELGIPTANIPLAGLSVGGHDDLESGIYYGWAGLDFVSSNEPASSDGSSSSVSAAPNGTKDATTTNGDGSSSSSGIASKVKQAVGNALFGEQQEDAAGTSSEEGSKKQQQHQIHPMVMSVGWNPFYKNSVRSVEVHIMHDFGARDFYGSHLNLIICGFIRPEFDYVDKESLIDDIRTDIDVAAKSLERPAYAQIQRDPFLLHFPKDEEGRSLKGDVAS